MDDIFNEFQNNITQIRQIGEVYTYLKDTIRLSAEDINDILRSQIVNVVSALDRYLHEKVRKGICDIFLGNRPITAKFKNFSLTSDTVMRVWGDSTLTVVEREMLINSAVSQSLKSLSFQQSVKIKDALSYLWDEPHKMTVLAIEMGMPGATDNDKQKYLNQRLDLLVERRNQIAHESDMVVSGKRAIAKQEVDDAVDFIENFVRCLNSHI